MTYFCSIISAYRKRCGKFRMSLNFWHAWIPAFVRPDAKPPESPASNVTDFPYRADYWNTPSFRQPPSSISLFLLLKLTFSPSLHPPLPLCPLSCVPHKCCQMRRRRQGSVAPVWTRCMNRAIVSPRPALTPWDKPASIVLCLTVTHSNNNTLLYVCTLWNSWFWLLIQNSVLKWYTVKKWL